MTHILVELIYRRLGLDSTLNMLVWTPNILGRPFARGLYDRTILPSIAFRLGPHVKGKYTKNKFEYITEWDVYLCPEKYFLKHKTTTHQGYKEYISDKETCKNCLNRDNCLTSDKAENRIIRRHVWEEFKERTVHFLKSDKGKRVYIKEEKK